MRNGIKLFEHFERIHLEVCITDKDRQRFERQYGLRAGGISPIGQDGYCERMLHNKQDAWGIEYRIYFETSKPWVIESLTKLGYYVEQPKHMIAIELDKHHPDHGYKLRVASTELFWWLVDYGYRLGKNNAIPYDFYLMREVLKAYSKRRKEVVPTLDMVLLESENPVVEAKMFAMV